MDQLYESVVMQNMVNQYQNVNQQKRQQMEAEKKSQIVELQRLFSVVSVNELVYTSLQQECYLVRLSNQMQIKLILEHDFPSSPPRLYTTHSMSHTLIDETTWQIKIQRGPLKVVFSELDRLFKQQPPEEDPFVEELTRLKTKVNDEQLLQKLQQVDLKTLFPNVQPNHYKELVESTELNEYIFRLPEYKQLAQYIVELAQANENFAKLLIEQNAKIGMQKSDLQQLGLYYENLKNQVSEKHAQCQNIRKQFDKSNILMLMEKEINRLDELSSEKVDGLQGSMQLIHRKEFDDDLQQYMEIRRQYHKLSIKKNKFEEMM